VKKMLVSFVLGCLITMGAVHVLAATGQKSTIMGEVIDIAGYAMKDARGEKDAEAGRFRAEKGFPVGILTEDGEVYVAVYKNPAPASGLETGNDILIDLMGKETVVRGTVYEAQGVKVIQIQIASEM
jgi:hypothetical protein